MAQRACLARATSDLTALLGVPPASFRAPTFKVSGPTMAVLDELEYRADLSVVSQRLGVFGSDIYSAGPLMAPRRPYHPSRRNPFRRGESRVWEIPLSACVLPFLSNTERLCGLAFMRVFFRRLHAEARVTGKPIVFMFHAEDLNPDRGVQQLGPPSWRDFVPTRANGFRFRHFLLERDWRRVSEDLMALFSHIASASSVRFLTVRDYLPELERRATPIRSDRP
jgi:hypothetical protein